jgi:hypothetical protein
MIGDTSSLGVGCAIMATSIPSNTCCFSRTILPPFPSSAGVPITDNYKCNTYIFRIIKHNINSLNKNVDI